MWPLLWPSWLLFLFVPLESHCQISNSLRRLETVWSTVTKASAISNASSLQIMYVSSHLAIVHSDKEVAIFLTALRQVPCYVQGHLSNNALILYWCIRPLFLVGGSRLAEQVSHCRHHISTSVLPCNQ